MVTRFPEFNRVTHFILVYETNIRTGLTNIIKDFHCKGYYIKGKSDSNKLIKDKNNKDMKN